jgi:hypothetical protein
VRRLIHATLLGALLVAPALCAAEAAPMPKLAPPARAEAAAGQPVITGPKDVAEHRLVRLKVENVPPGNFVFWDVFPMERVDVATQRVKGEFEFVAPPGTYKVRVRLAKNPDLPALDLWHTVTVGGVPTPTPPQPKPDDPKPPPVVTSFRVMFVYESAQGLTIPAAVRDYLTAKTTKDGDHAGWLRIDKDRTGEELPPTLKAMWRAVKPSVTAVPCMAVEVNGRVEIVPIPPTTDATLAALKAYLGEK